MSDTTSAHTEPTNQAPDATNGGHKDTMLIAYDGSVEAKRALEYAGRFLSTPRAYILTAWEPLQHQANRGVGASMAGAIYQPADNPEDGDPAHAEALQTCKEGVQIARENGFEAEPFLVESATTIWSAIVDAAEELHADVIVSGTRGLTGFKSLFQASVSDNVLRHSGKPVLIVPPLPDSK